MSEKEQPTRAQLPRDNMDSIDPMVGIFQARKSTPLFESILVGSFCSLQVHL